MNITWKMTGLEELQKTMEEIPLKISRQVLRGTLKEAGEDLKEALVVAVPDSTDRATGFLSEHFDVRIRVKSNELEATAFVGPQGHMYYPDRGEAKRGVSTGKFPKKGGLVPVASVARFLEFGTKKMRPHPFMSTTFEAKKESLLNKIIQGIRDALKQWIS